MFTVHGGDPKPPASPGDVLNVDLSGVANPQLHITSAAASGSAGSWAFGNRQSITFDGIESVSSANGKYGLVLDMKALGFQDGSTAPDLITAQLDSTGTNFTVTVNGDSGPSVTEFHGAAADVNTFTMLGSSDPEAFNLVGSAGGLPSFPVVVDGGGGSNILVVDESGATAGDTLTIGAGSIFSSTHPFNLTFQASNGGTFNGGVYVTTGSGNDTVFVTGTAPNAPLILNTGGGDDAVSISSVNLTLDTLHSPVNVDLGGGNNILAVGEAGSTVADNLIVSSYAVGNASQSFSVFYEATGGTINKGVYVAAGSGDNTVNVVGTAAT
jgi:hypothetical protein